MSNCECAAHEGRLWLRVDEEAWAKRSSEVSVGVVAGVKVDGGTGASGEVLEGEDDGVAADSINAEGVCSERGGDGSDGFRDVLGGDAAAEDEIAGFQDDG